MKNRARTRELQPLPKTKSRRVHGMNESWQRLYATVTDPELQTVVAFCLIGFLLTLNVMLRFPDLGAIIEQYNQF